MEKCKSSNYINWDFDATTVKPNELNDIFDELGINTTIPCKANGLPQTNKIKYLTSKNGVCVCKKNNCDMFYLVRKECKKVPFKNKYIDTFEYKPTIYRVSANNSNPTDEHMNATKIFNKFMDMFKEEYGVSFYYSFRRTPDMDFRRCIPKPINYGAYNAYPYMHVFKADISSAYGYELSKSIPTAKDMVEIEGLVKPNKEYPFAFYIKEGCLEVYGENIKSNLQAAEKTYLMKASSTPLKPIIDRIYAAKEAATNKDERQSYKDLLNIPVGYFQKKDNPAFAYITAVVIARCNERVNSWAQSIEEKGNHVILINTDAIAWDGKDMPEIYTTEKGLGNFMLENRDAIACVKGPKCYQIKQNGEVKTIYAGLPKKYHDKIEFGGIMDMDYELEAFIWNPETLRYDMESINDFYMLRGKNNGRN